MADSHYVASLENIGCALSPRDGIGQESNRTISPLLQSISTASQSSREGFLEILQVPSMPREEIWNKLLGFF